MICSLTRRSANHADREEKPPPWKSKYYVPCFLMVMVLLMRTIMATSSDSPRELYYAIDFIRSVALNLPLDSSVAKSRQKEKSKRGTSKISYYRSGRSPPNKTDADNGHPSSVAELLLAAISPSCRPEHFVLTARPDKSSPSTERYWPS